MKSSRSLALKARMRREGFVELKLHGRCMEPFLMVGDMARICPVDKVEVGDICLIELEGGELALHRIVRKKSDDLLTKGDYSGLVEKRKIKDALGCVKALRFQNADRWVAYVPSKMAKRRSAWLSRNIARCDEKGFGSTWRKLYRRIKWREGIRMRARALSHARQQL